MLFFCYLRRAGLYLLPGNNNIIGRILSDGAVAQLVEQRTENPCVPGSSPGGATNPQQKLGVFILSQYLLFNIFNHPC